MENSNRMLALRCQTTMALLREFFKGMSRKIGSQEFRNAHIGYGVKCRELMASGPGFRYPFLVEAVYFGF